MSATVMRDKRQTTLPTDVCKAAGLRPGDRINWRFESGAIIGEKLVPESVEEMDLEDLDPRTLGPKDGTIDRDSIVKAVREDRERRR